jgi:hypothetical protein
MCTMNWGHMLWTLIDAPTLFVSRALSETRTTRDLRHPATTNTRYYSQTRYLQRNTTSPLLHSTSAPRTSRLPHKPKPQVLLLRFPPPLRSRGALPRCIPPRALSPYQACDRTLFQRPSYRSRSTPLSLQLDLFARTIGDVLSHFVRAVERVLSNSKRVELTTRPPRERLLRNHRHLETIHYYFGLLSPTHTNTPHVDYPTSTYTHAVNPSRENAGAYVLRGGPVRSERLPTRQEA